MKTLDLFTRLAIAAALAIAAIGCGDDDGMTTPRDSGTDTGMPPGDGGDTDGGDTDGGMGGDFTFRTDDPSMYMQVDRSGMPAVSTALIPAERKDAYNQADPADDAALMFAGDLLGSLGAIHMALDDDLTGAGLAPCDMTGAMPACAYQEVAPGVPVVSLVVPDTIKVNPAGAAGFPNGRQLTDPVMDVTLSIILLDLTSMDGCGGMACTATTLVGLLNPTMNDVAFSTTFPYLAAPHTP